MWSLCRGGYPAILVAILMYFFALALRFRNVLVVAHSLCVCVCVCVCVPVPINKVVSIKYIEMLMKVFIE